MHYRLLFGLFLCVAVCSGQPINLRFDHITSEHGLPQNTIHGIAKDKSGFMWFGTWSGLCRYDGYQFKIYRYDPSDPKSINNNRIHNLLTDEEQRLWIMTFDEQVLCRYNDLTDDFERIPIEQVPPDIRERIQRKNYHMNTVYRFRDREWRLNHEINRLVETNLKTGENRRYVEKPGIRGSLNDSYVSDVYLDDQDILWVGTYNNGINKANLNSLPFNTFYHIPSDPRSIIDDHVRALCEDLNGDLWVGTRDRGITVIGRNGSYRHLRHNPADPHSLRSDQIRSIYCDSRGHVWIGTKEGLDRYHPQTGRMTHYDLLTVEVTPVYGMVEDRSGRMWFATWNGIYSYVPGSDRLVHIDPTETLLQVHTWTIMEDRRGHIWVGTEGGGITILKKSGSDHVEVERHIVHRQADGSGLSDNRVYALYEDRHGIVWIGTGNGLNRLDPRTGAIQQFLVSPNGLPNAMIAGIVEDDNGYLWVSHKAGISRIDKNTFTVRNYSLQDGLQSNEFLEGAVLKSRYSGKLYFGGNNGFNVFHPDSIITDERPPRIALTGLQILNKQVQVGREVNGRILLTRPFHLMDTLRLDYRDKSIAIEFAALHFANPSRNRYAYMLEGFDEDWIYTDAAHRVATYSNLAPGRYLFKVRASNSDGVWNPEAKTLAIIVAPAFWESPWAYVVYIIVFLSLLYAFYYHVARYAKLNSKLEYETLLHEKERLHHESKVQFFTNISHEIKTPLTLILAPIQQLMSLTDTNSAMKQQLRTMKVNGDRLLKLVNQLLDIRRLETGNEHLKPERREIVSFVQEIADSFHHLAQLGNITLTTAAELPAIYGVFDPDKLEKVIYNLLSNAFKFTGLGGQVAVRIGLDRPDGQTPAVRIEVADTGPGIPPEDLPYIFDPFRQGRVTHAGGTGLGLAYSKSLIELHGGTISVASETGETTTAGTVFTVRLPLEPEHYRTMDVSTGSTSDDISYTVPEDVLPGAVTIRNKHDQLEQGPEQGEAKGVGKRHTLLLVEDNAEMRRYLSDYFSSTYHVIEANNGVEGLAAAVKYAPDIVVSDVMMSEMDGFTFCRKLKNDIVTGHIPVILLTARTMIEYEIEGIRTGADDYLVKPFNLTLLSLKIANLLRTRNLLRERYKKQITIEPNPLQAESPDERLLQRVMTYIENRLAEPGLSVDDICDEIGLSRTQLYRKMKALTGLSIGEIIKEIRLKRAQQLLRGTTFNINEIAYMTGFSDPDYFRKCFKARFDISPTEYSREFQRNPDASTIR